MNTKYKRIFIILALIIVGVLIVKFDLIGYLSIDNLVILQGNIKSLGVVAPIAFIVLYIVAAVFFLPGLPLTLLSGIAFGPVLGTIYVSIASVIGASCCFLIARTLGRSFIEEKLKGNDIFVKLDEGVEREGWKMVMITRLIPLFPFNLQNYVYGLTKIKFGTFMLVSWIFMLPGTIAYVFLAGSIVSGESDLSKTLTYIAIGGIFLLGMTILQKVYQNKQNKKIK